MMENIKVNKQKQIKSIFQKATTIELDLLGRLQQFNSNKIINIIDALKNPYVADLHEQYADKEIAYEKPIKISMQDNVKYSVK